jgi:tetratricopeptide (TPR) repeat protein
LTPRPQSWQLDPLNLTPGLQVQGFVDRCESGYIAVFIRNNLPVKPDLCALLLFGTLDQQARVERLTELAQRTCTTEFQLKSNEVEVGSSCYLRDIPELDIALQDMEAMALDEAPSLQRAEQLNSEGLRIRTTDFEQARSYFLKAARMVWNLLQQGEPGANRMDLEWYLASYCAATAGANFFRFDYDQAFTYYIAFFALTKETRPAWEKIQRLIQPLLSFYFTIAANVHGELLEFPPGRTHPARIAIALNTHNNLAVRKRWLSDVRELSRVNPAPLRMVIQRLDVFEKTAEIPGVQETRDTLASIVEAAENDSGMS